MSDEYHTEDGIVKPEVYAEVVSKRRFNAPQKMRAHEVRDGGFIVVERTRKKRLLRPSAWPVELGSLAAAFVATKRLREKFPDREFAIFEQVGALAPESE